MESESPRQRPTCCFCFTTSTKEKKSTRSLSTNGDSLSNSKMEILSDVSTFSVKEQERRLKKALKEEEKISREAEKVVNWVKQQSARMDVSAIEKITKDDPYNSSHK